MKLKTISGKIKISENLTQKGDYVFEMVVDEKQLSQGWVCPKCGRIHNPRQRQCVCGEAVCSFCGVTTLWFETMGYGSKYDGAVVCTDCLDLALGQLKNEN